MGNDVIKTRTSRELGTLRRMIFVAFVLLFRFLLWDHCVELHWWCCSNSDRLLQHCWAAFNNLKTCTDLLWRIMTQTAPVEANNKQEHLSLFMRSKIAKNDRFVPLPAQKVSKLLDKWSTAKVTLNPTRNATRNPGFDKHICGKLAS